MLSAARPRALHTFSFPRLRRAPLVLSAARRVFCLRRGRVPQESTARGELASWWTLAGGAASAAGPRKAPKVVAVGVE